ncbi:MAG: hypothetical protein AABW50_01070 [Nanoarchaeota archaeon]
MEEEKVKRYLDDILVRLEVSEAKDRELRTEFVIAVNFYKSCYDLKDYGIKANEILSQYA